jgi:hypothetical protein
VSWLAASGWKTRLPSKLILASGPVPMFPDSARRQANGDVLADSEFVGLLWGCQPGFLSVGHDLNAKYHHAMTLMTGTMANKHQSGLCPVRRRMLIAGMKTIRNETSMKAGE